MSDLETNVDVNNKKKEFFLKPFMAFLRKRKWVFIASFCTLLVTNLLTLITPLLIGASTDLIKQISVHGSPDAANHGLFFKAVSWGLFSNSSILLRCAMALFAIETMLWLTRYFWRKYNYALGPYSEYDLRLALLTHLQKLSPSFFVRNRTGELMSRATADISQVANFFMSGSIIFFDSIVYILTVPFVLFYLNWKLTLYFLVPLPLLIIMTRYFTRKIFKQSHKVQQQEAELSAKVQENIAGARVVKSFSQETNEVNAFRKVNEMLIDKSYVLLVLNAMFHPLLTVSVEGIVLLVWMVGGMAILYNQMTIGDFIAYNLFLGRLTWPMVGTGITITLYQIGKASMERINKILDTPPEIYTMPDAEQNFEVKGEVEFRNLNFRYTSDGREVLKDFNLRIPAGKTVALVGPVGCGKTTVINLVPRLFDPPDNTVFIDGVDVRKVPLDNLRSAIGYAPQEPFLFSDTISENIAIGVGKCDPEEIVKAAEIAALDNDVDQFYNKYEQVVGERGVTLSGGQKQRTTIARAAIINPKILLLDDTLASVDAKTEETILRNFRELRGNRTCLMASHRISTIKDADLIVVLNEGAIAERGTHDDLLKNNGLYAELYRKQLLREQLGMG